MSNWQSYIEQKVGFVLPTRQEHWLHRAILAVAKNNAMSVDALFAAVQTDEQMWQQVIATVLIPESRFFRHIETLNYISQCADDSMGSCRVWSVGCANGQEIWSLAMVMQADNHRFELWGSDVNKAAIEYATHGRYAIRYLQEIPEQYHHFALKSEQEKSSRYWYMSDRLRDSVQFFQHNIFSEPLPSLPKMNVILCQNVLIYFRQFDQRDILFRLVQQLEVGGYLVLAPGEASFWQHPQMRRIRHSAVNVWQKIDSNNNLF